MPKRQKLDYDSEKLTQNLKQSAGQGVDALFSHPSSPPPEKQAEAGAEDTPRESPRATNERPRSPSGESETTQPSEAYARTDSADVRAAVLLHQVPPAPEKRRPERYAFQFWADQITRLKKLNQVLNLAKDPEDRDEITLSDMVREAMDDYLAKHIERIKHDDRSDE